MGHSTKGKAAASKSKPKGSTAASGHEATRGFTGTMGEIKKFWSSIPVEQQKSLLRLNLEDVRTHARSLDLQSKQVSGTRMEQCLDQLAKYGTWKSWRWGPDQEVFYTEQSFRENIRDHHVDKELQAYLPAVDTNLSGSKLPRLQLARSVHEGTVMKGWDSITTITHVLKEFETHEHPYLKCAFWFPICSTICDLIPENRRKTTHSMLTVADLGKLPASKLNQIYMWIVQHIHLQELDHLMLSPDQTHLQITPAWQLRLESANEFAWNPQNQALYGPSSGHHMRSQDMLLSWLYEDRATERLASVKSKHPQGAPIAEAHKQLLDALADLKSWTDRSVVTKELMLGMLKVRSNVQDLAAKYSFNLGPCSKAVMDDVLSSDDPVCGGALTWPDNLILAVLEREHNLTSAKLHELRFERLTKETHVYHLRRLINLNEPEFRFLEKVTETKGRRSQNWERAGSDRQGKQGLDEFKALQADSDDCELAIRFEKHTAKLEEMSQDDQRTQRQMMHLDTEIKELAAWMQNLARMAHVLAAAGELGPLRAPERGDFSPGHAARANPQLETAGVSAGLWGPAGVSRSEALSVNTDSAHTLAFETPGSVVLKKARLHMWITFQKHVWPWLYDNAEDRKLFTALQSQLKFIKEYAKDGYVALHHLEAELVAAACTDPSVEVEKQLVLPLMRDQIHAAAKDLNTAQDQDDSENTDYRNCRASHFSQQLLQEEEKAAARAAAKKAKKQKQKSKKQEGKAQQDAQQQPEEQEEEEAEQDTEQAYASSPPMQQPAAEHGTSSEPVMEASSSKAAAEPTSGSAQPEPVKAEPVKLHSLPQKAAQSTDSDAEKVGRLLQCPLTKEMMAEPVIAADGHTYERKAVQEWLQHHKTSPVTGCPLAHTRLLPNVIIRSVLDRHQQQQSL